MTAPPDYVVVCNPTILSSSPGGSASSICTVGSLRGFNAPVDLACSGLPAGVTCGLRPADGDAPGQQPGGSALQIAIAASVPTGNYPFSVTGTSGSLTRSAALTLRPHAHRLLRQLRDRDGLGDQSLRHRHGDARPVGAGGPEQYTGGGIVIQNGTTPSGVNDLVTGASTAGSNGDIDGGFTSIQSPPIALPAACRR